MSTHQEILNDIGRKRFSPVYLLHGEESYFIDLVAEALEEQVLSEPEKAFNFHVFYGKDTDYLAVLDAARRFPVMSERQLVIIKEAQDMKTLKDLAPYAEKPAQSTILVICYKNGKVNMTSSLGKALKANGVVLETKRLYDNKIPEWIAEYLQVKQLRVRPETAALIAEFLGSELSKVANELDKLALNMPPGKEVTIREVEEHIGISKDYNVFELQKAIGQRDILKANRIVAYFSANPRRNPIQMVLGALYNYLSKVYLLNALRNSPEKDQLDALGLRSAFFLKDYKEALRYLNAERAEAAIGVLKEFDLKSKGVGYNATGKEEGELMKELVWKLLHL